MNGDFSPNQIRGLGRRKAAPMTAFNFNKQWYKSTRFTTFLITLILLVANDMFSLGIEAGTVEMVVAMAAVYIVGKSAQDVAGTHAEVKGTKLAEIAKASSLPPT